MDTKSYIARNEFVFSVDCLRASSFYALTYHALFVISIQLGWYETTGICCKLSWQWTSRDGEGMYIGVWVQPLHAGWQRNETNFFVLKFGETLTLLRGERSKTEPIIYEIHKFPVVFSFRS